MRYVHRMAIYFGKKLLEPLLWQQGSPSAAACCRAGAHQNDLFTRGPSTSGASVASWAGENLENHDCLVVHPKMKNMFESVGMIRNLIYGKKQKMNQTTNQMNTFWTLCAKVFGFKFSPLWTCPVMDDGFHLGSWTSGSITHCSLVLANIWRKSKTRVQVYQLGVHYPTIFQQFYMVHTCRNSSMKPQACHF